MPSHDTTRSGFFAVGQQTFHKTCALGINAASAFLVLARGTGKDNSTTSWSANAVRTYAGVRYQTAVTAINALTTAKLAKKAGSIARPTYKLQKDGELIWLPNAVVDGVGAEKAPVARIRETQDAMLLRLFVDLYSAQNLAEDGGISTGTLYKKFERRLVGQRGEWAIWEFMEGCQYLTWMSITNPHRIAELSEEQKEAGIRASSDLWKRFGRLESFGLFTWVPYIFDGPEGEPMYALVSGSGIAIEEELYAASEYAVTSILTEAQYDIALERGGELAPVRIHVEHAQMIGVARLHYRPHTSMTSAWWAKHEATCRQMIHDLSPYVSEVTDAAA